MKKILMTAVMAIAVSFAMAQDNVLTNKKGTPILPTQGAWAFSIDATPFLTYAGGIFSNNHATAPMFTNGGIFSAKYFWKDDCALRLKVSINRESDRYVMWVPEHNRPAGSDAQVKNAFRQSSSEIVLMPGIQKIIGGKTRLVGFYGAEAILGYGAMTDKWTHGNALSADNTLGGA
jgi:hypothetical protein